MCSVKSKNKTKTMCSGINSKKASHFSDFYNFVALLVKDDVPFFCCSMHMNFLGFKKKS